MRKFTISDIHGCLKSFRALLQKIDFSKADELYLLGDFVDRGPDSKGVFDHIWSLQEQGYTVHCISGNHEEMCLDSFTALDKDLYWKKYGGINTLASFMTKGEYTIPSKYLEFMKQMPRYLEVDQYILVHAGLNFDMPNPLEAKQSMHWIRNWYKDINRLWLGDRIIVHGHTPTAKEMIERQVRHLDEIPVLDIDAGCVFDRPGMRHLCAFELGSQQLFFQQNIDGFA